MEAGWSSVGKDAEAYTWVGGILRRKTPLGPELPPAMPNGDAWTSGALGWYEKFRVSPQAELITTDIEWLTVQQAVVLLSLFEEKANPKYWTAFMNLTAKFGLTSLDKRRIRVEVAKIQESKSEKAAVAASEQADFDAEFERLMNQG